MIVKLLFDVFNSGYLWGKKRDHRILGKRKRPYLARYTLTARKILY